MPLEERMRRMVERNRETLTEPSIGEPVETKLSRIAQKARENPDLVFINLYHLLKKELLRECFEELRGDAVSGIDRVTKELYGQNLEENLTDLEARLQRMAYKPHAVRRTYIPKPGTTKQRPLGIPCLEDKLVQSGLVRILESIYEQKFIEDSYGFRPGRGCHDALRALSHTVERRKTNYIVEADIKGFFDNVNHDWMMKFLAHRIGDKRVLRLIKRFLKAGVIEEGKKWESEKGTPQGGVISPLLANIYLHYVLDLWFMLAFQKTCLGQAQLIRYADDFVVCFERGEDAQRFQTELIERLAMYGLEVEPSKTKVLAFGSNAANLAKQQGRRKPDTFDFLGFTHFCSRTRDGKRFRMKRKTARKKFREKLLAFKEWIMKVRTLKTRQIWNLACAKLRGHYAYYGVTDNSSSITSFWHEVKRLLYKWLNRRGKRGCFTWPKFVLMDKRFPLPRPRIKVNLLSSV
jgi:group II intron reverse transcriptase/maturase